MKKVVLVGDSCVGKTSLMKRVTTGVYSISNEPTIYANFFYLPTLHGNLTVWDAGGHSRIVNFLPSILDGAHAVIICVEKGKLSSFLRHYEICNRLLQFETFIYVCVTKFDDAGSTIPMLSVGRYLVRGMFVTSTKENRGIREMFDRVSYDLYEAEKH